MAAESSQSWAAAFIHLAYWLVLPIFWLPLVFYLAYRGRSEFLAGHGLQASVYQGLVVAILAVLSTAIYGLRPLFTDFGFRALILFLVVVVPLLLIVMAVPTFYAAAAAARGEDYHYPYLGDLVS